MSGLRGPAWVGMGVALAVIVGLSLFLWMQPAKLEPLRAEQWVRPLGPSPVYWLVWAEVKEYLGDERFDALDREWMADRARTDLSVLGPQEGFGDEAMFEGLWRLGLEREAVAEAIAAREGDPSWPLGADRRHHAWRPRLQRWWSAQVDPAAELGRQLELEWAEATQRRDCLRMSRVLAAREEFLQLEPTADQRFEAHRVTERLLAALSDGTVPAGVVDLFERCGVPDGFDLERYLRDVRERYRQLENEPLPLPHPYLLRLEVARLERLAVE